MASRRCHTAVVASMASWGRVWLERRSRGSFVTRLPAQVSSKEVLDYLGFRDSKFMHAAFQLLGEPWDGSRMDFGETVKCIAQFCMRARGVPQRFHFINTTRGHRTRSWVVF